MINSLNHRRGILALVATLGAMFAFADVKCEIEPPKSAVYNVRDYGAKGDGRTKDTAAIQRAIDAASAAGGGTVELPMGTYLSGTIYLKSNVDFHLAEYAELRSSVDPADFNPTDVCVQNWASKNESHRGGHLVMCIEQENVTVRGPGAINGCSETFCVRDDGYVYFQHEIPFRPAQMLCFIESKNLRLENLRLFDSPYWSCYLHGCENVSIERLNVRTRRRPYHTQNGDGIDIDCCEHVQVADCDIDTADDSITLRGDCKRLKENRECRDIKVSNCRLSSSCNAIRIGVGDGVVRDAEFDGIVIRNSRTAISFVSSWLGKGRGVDISDITFRNFDIDAAKYLTVHPECGKATKFERITYENMVGADKIAEDPDFVKAVSTRYRQGDSDALAGERRDRRTKRLRK